MHSIFNGIALGVGDIGFQIFGGLYIIDRAGHSVENAGGHGDVLEHAAEIVDAHLVPVALVNGPFLGLKIGEHGAGEAGDAVACCIGVDGFHHVLGKDIVANFLSGMGEAGLVEEVIIEARKIGYEFKSLNEFAK